MQWFRFVSLGSLVGALLLLGPALPSHGWSNAGMVLLAQALSSAPDGAYPQALSRAEGALQQAVAWTGENRGAHRGLGWVLALRSEDEQSGAEELEAAIQAWRTGGFTAQDFINAGKETQWAGRYRDALWWYERAIQLRPDLRDSWYYLGIAYERLERWQEALGAYERAGRAGASANVGRSSLLYRTGLIYHLQSDSQEMEEAIATYRKAIEVDDFTNPREAAACHFRLGQILWQTGGDPDPYVAELERAIELDPENGAAHILLGEIHYVQYGDAATAEAEILRGLEFSPGSKWAYVKLGDIYRQEGRMDEAVKMYRRALEIVPDFEAARRRLQEVQR